MIEDGLAFQFLFKAVDPDVYFEAILFLENAEVVSAAGHLPDMFAFDAEHLPLALANVVLQCF